MFWIKREFLFLFAIICEIIWYISKLQPWPDGNNTVTCNSFHSSLISQDKLSYHLFWIICNCSNFCFHDLRFFTNMTSHKIFFPCTCLASIFDDKYYYTPFLLWLTLSSDYTKRDLPHVFEASTEKFDMFNKNYV